MKIRIELYCPHCQSTKIKKNDKKSSKKQNYLCKDCGRRFIGDHALTYKDCHPSYISVSKKCLYGKSASVIQQK
ncbi:MAG: hypothetical protein FWF52_00800 [Candidatus Azobacteroides sp.]|nr:hypothetical protein [Candidatus Azobacteroides sp.]